MDRIRNESDHYARSDYPNYEHDRIHTHAETYEDKLNRWREGWRRELEEDLNAGR